MDLGHTHQEDTNTLSQAGGPCTCRPQDFRVRNWALNLVLLGWLVLHPAARASLGHSRNAPGPRGKCHTLFQ